MITGKGLQIGGDEMRKYGDLATEMPELAIEWHPVKNNDLSPHDVSIKSSKDVWWLGKCGHEWKTKVINRTSGKGCPFCSGLYAIDGVNDLLTLKPELAKQWDDKRNGMLTPKDVKPMSNRKVWWICDKGHEWEAIIADRVRGRGCPVCSGRKVLFGYNDLETLCPQVSKQWHDSKNEKLTPQDVSIWSNRKVWWKCEEGHEWQACVSARVNGNGCPYCSGRFAIKGVNDLLTINPDLAKEWDFEKNGSLMPQDVKPKSNKKVWWICDVGHEWKATIYNRSVGKGCPYCQAEFKTSFPEQAIFFYLSKVSHVVNRAKLDKREIDVYLPQLKIGIEYDGLYYHNSSASEKREKSKNIALENQGIRLIRIKESHNDNKIVDNIIYYVPNHNYSNLNQAIVKLFTIIDEFANTNYSKEIPIDIEKDRIEICELYKQIIRSISLNEKYPEITKEWNAEKNGLLLPKMFSSVSNQKVWWKCNKAHEWQATISNRTNHETGCPYCAGKKVLAGFNDLATENPEIAEQWHPTKNKPLTPQNVTSKSHRKVWWVCDKGHDYEMTVQNKSLGQGCPYCSGRYAIAGENDLAVAYPELAKQWNYNKNNVQTPQDVKPQSNLKVWWICDAGHEWSATVASRVQGKGCPYCSGRFVIKGVNDLLTVNPKLAEEWNFEKNGSLTPRDVKPKSNKKVWWKCELGHEWQATINNRSVGRGCPYCRKQK